MQGPAPSTSPPHDRSLRRRVLSYALACTTIVGSIAAPPATHAAPFSLPNTLELPKGNPLPTSLNADTFSDSPIGQSVFLAYLEDLGYAPKILRRAGAARITSDDVVFFIEPILGHGTDSRRERALRDYLDTGATVVVVAPKHVPILRSKWGDTLLRVTLVEQNDVLRTLQWFDQYGVSVMRDAPEHAGLWTEGALHLAPTLRHPQTLSLPHDDATILYGTRDAALAFEAEYGFEKRVVVISDPEPFANYGIAKPGNAAFIRTLMAYVAPTHGQIYIDEGMHGYDQRYSPVAPLKTFPNWMVVVQAVLLVLVLLWQSLVPSTRRPSTVRPAHRAGSGLSLTHASARFLRQTVAPQQALTSYRAGVLRQALAKRHWPTTMDQHAQILSLEAQRPPTRTLSELDAQWSVDRPLSKKSASRLAAQYRRWQSEVSHGS